MFPVDQLAGRFEVNNPTHKFLKPWWDIFTDYLAAAILVVALLSSAIQATKDNVFCLPAVDCSFNQGTNATWNGNSMTPSSNLCHNTYNPLFSRSSGMTVLTKLQDNSQYDFVKAECGYKAVHWFASYFSLIMFMQAVALIVVDNFWLKFPQTSSKMEHFVSLVIECYNSPGTCLVVSNVLWGTRLSDDVSGKATSEDIERGSVDRQRQLSTSDYTTDAVTPSSSRPDKDTTNTLELSEAIKAKTLYEKVRQFRNDVERKQDRLTLERVYLIQAVIQLVLSIAFLAFNAGHHATLKRIVKCDIDDAIKGTYNYFKCSHVLVPYFQASLVIFYLLIVPYLLSCLFICYWTLMVIKKPYDFLKEHVHSTFTLLLSDIRDANGDLSFMLFLMDEYSKLYSLRFAVFLSQKNETKLKHFILLKEWPIKKLQMNTEEGGRKLKLTNLSGIPKSVFELSELDSLILENCTLTEDDFDCEDWMKLKLRSLSLIRCNLTCIPTAILQMTSLETLDVSQNRISSVPQEICQLRDLHDLNIYSNNVTKGVENINALGNLRILNLRENNVSLQLSFLTGHPSLVRLHIDETMLAKMSEETKTSLKDILVTKESSWRDIDVIKYSPSHAPHIEEARKNYEKVYKMTSRPKGLAVIWNNVHYSRSSSDMFLPDRKGSEVDGCKLEKLFFDMGYKVNLQEDITLMELRDQLNDEDAVKYDSFILAVLTHGSERGIHLSCGHTITVEDIVSLLGQNKGYVDKPKIIIIQACRGSAFITTDVGDNNDYDGVLKESTQERPVVLSPIGEYVFQVDNLTDAVNSPRGCSRQESTIPISVPAFADVLIAYSTLPGHVSWRNTETGSWFIQALVEVFSKYAWEEDVLSLLTYVNYEVSRRLSLQGYRQVPAPQSTLTKKLYFLPGYFEDDEIKT